MKKLTFNKRKIFRWICIAIVIACVAYIGISIYKTYKAQKAYEDLRKYKNPTSYPTATQTLTPSPTATMTPTATPSMSPTPTNSPTPTEPVILQEYETLYNMNNDMIGWIKLDDTVIDYPVMFIEGDVSEFYYLKRDFNKQDSNSGSIFVDGRCYAVGDRSQNVIIYGHNMRAGTMFAALHKLKDKSFWESHHLIRFDTIYSEDLYEIVGVLKTPVYTSEDKVFKIYNFINAKNEEEYKEFSSYVKEKSLFDTGLELQYGDETITLMTCTDRDRERLVVVARKIKTAE